MKKLMGKKQGLVSLCIVLLVALTMTACGDKNETGEDNGKELTKITFCLDWTPNTNHTGIYVAKAMGYYEDAGIDLEIVQPPEDGALLMCSSGEAQFAVDAQDTMAGALDSDTPLDVSATAAIIQHNSSGIISRAGDGIDSPKGLSGKTYSTWGFPVEVAMLENVVTKDGGDYDSIKLIPNNITDEPAALKAKQTDAIWVFEGWGVVNAEVEKVDVDFWRFADISEELDYYTPVIIGNNSYMDDNPEITKSFMEATKKGYEYAIDNPQEAAEMLIEGDTTGSLRGSEELIVKSQEWMANEYAADVDSWGEIDPARWNRFYTWLYENNLTKKDLTGTGYRTDWVEDR